MNASSLKLRQTHNGGAYATWCGATLPTPSLCFSIFDARTIGQHPTYPFTRQYQPLRPLRRGQPGRGGAQAGPNLFCERWNKLDCIRSVGFYTGEFWQLAGDLHQLYAGPYGPVFFRHIRKGNQARPEMPRQKFYLLRPDFYRIW